MSAWMAFLPESVFLAGALVLFALTLGRERWGAARWVGVATGLGATLAAGWSFGAEGTLFDGAYRVEAFSQAIKLAVAGGYVVVLLLGEDLPDIRPAVRAEYHFLLLLSVLGLVLVSSCVEAVSLVVSLELSSFPLYLLVAMRREREGMRMQMESAIKYLLFGVAANGLMFFGFSYLFGLTGTTSLPAMAARLSGTGGSPVALAGLVLVYCGLLYKLAVFPFHFWTPDVYQGAANETAGMVASLPKVAAVAVLVRLAALAPAGSGAVATVLTVLAVASMCYGNLIALMQDDVKRLLGFSGIAHAGYALIGFVTLDRAGWTASVFYLVSYLAMVLACFVVVCRVARDGGNVARSDLVGLHRRSPLLALTLLVGVFALAGVPPFAGFMGKLALLKAALARGHLALVIIAVANSAIAIYYYLGLVREAYFRDAEAAEPIPNTWGVRVACAGLMAVILGLGLVPSRVLGTIERAVAQATSPARGAATAAPVSGMGPLGGEGVGMALVKRH